jgi:hypothetical protein
MFPARAKRVIFLFMHGGPSSIDTFDPKPYLDANDGKPLPIKQPLTFAAKTGGLMKSPWKFKNCGQSGLPISDLFPNIRECADDLCVVRSMVGEGVDHGAALLQTFTGTFTFTRPSVGPGCFTDSARRTAICPATSPSSRRSRTAAPRTGRPVSCRARCKVRPSATPACR